MEKHSSEPFNPNIAHVYYLAAIPIKALSVFHGKPVWSAQYGRLLVNAIDKIFLSPDGRVIPFADCEKLFAAVQLFSESTLPDCSPLSLSDVKKVNKFGWSRSLQTQN